MGRDLMGYDVMAQDALRGLVRRALVRAAGEGLPGEHHFYINFATSHPGVVLPDSLREKFPNDMIIVLQHQFWELEAGEDSFSVTLQFNKMPQRLTVPYRAIISFVDPSVQFGLRFQVEGYQPAGEAAAPVPADAGGGKHTAPEPDSAPRGGAGRAADDGEGSGEVVNLDTFRKK